jgi:hypothetical protein
MRHNCFRFCGPSCFSGVSRRRKLLNLLSLNRANPKTCDNRINVSVRAENGPNFFNRASPSVNWARPFVYNGIFIQARDPARGPPGPFSVPASITSTAQASNRPTKPVLLVATSVPASIDVRQSRNVSCWVGRFWKIYTIPFIGRCVH